MTGAVVGSGFPGDDFMDIGKTATRPRRRAGVPGEALAAKTVGENAVTVAGDILAFATGGTAGCTSGRAMARLYLLLTEGAPVPLKETSWGLDDTRRAWWEAATLEFSRGTWGGTREGAARVRKRHPYIARPIDAALTAYDAVERASRTEAIR